MELSISHSSTPVIPAITTNRYKPKCNVTLKSYFHSKCSTNKILSLPVGLYGKSSWPSKSLLYGQQKPNSIRASAQDASADSDTVFTKVSRFGLASYEFIRPYAIQQAILASVSLFARVFIENPELFKWSLVFKAFPGLIAIVLANAYYIGINQIYDVDIDRINKPYLPIPAGKLSLKLAWFLVIFDLLATLMILWLTKADLFTASLLCLGLFFGTLYSVPPVRLKRSSITASFMLCMMGGIIHNIGVSYATRASLGLTSWWSPSVAFITSFVTIFLLVISNAKDLTDVEGDRKYNVRTFTVVFGARNVARFCTGMLLINYIGAMAAAIYVPQAFKSYIMLPVHAILALCLLFQARKLDQGNYTKEAIISFIKFLWKLLNLEYFIFLLI